MRCLVQPGPETLAEVLDEEPGVGRGGIADRVNAERGELFRRLRADAVDLACGQWPDALRNVCLRQERQAVGLVELGGDLREQLVRRDADRAAEPGRVAHHCLERKAHGAAGVVVNAGQLAEVDVDLVDAAVLDDRRDASHGRLEQARVLAVFVEVDRQQDCVGREHGRLHHAHGREDAELARFVGARRDDAAADVVTQREKAARAVGLQQRLAVAAAADHDRQPAQLRIAQQFDRRVERIHVEVSDQPAHGCRW